MQTIKLIILILFTSCAIESELYQANYLNIQEINENYAICIDSEGKEYQIKHLDSVYFNVCQDILLYNDYNVYLVIGKDERFIYALNCEYKTINIRDIDKIYIPGDYIEVKPEFKN